MSGPVSPTAVIDLCDVSPRRITELAFLTAMLEQLPHASSCCITHPTVPTALLPRGAEVLSSWTTTAGLELVATDGRCIYRIEAYKTIVVTVSAPTQADATLATAAVVERAGDPPAGRFPAWVWHATDRGGTLRRRDLEGPAWPSVAHNYPPAARDRLTSLMARDGLESAEARLILLHGEPGTGKTTAIRALLRAWAPWCEAHIIGDPDRLFDNVAYLLEVVGRPPAHTAPTLTAAASGDRWKLLVAEDTDTFLRSTAGKDAGHGLSRLLNVTDGLLGQAENTLVLLTTNEDLARLHPAIIRPGRCLASIELTRFAKADADQWLTRHGGTAAARSGDATLAELYELERNGTRPAPILTTGTYL